jgi:peptidyl-dipeptidase A
MGVGDINKDFGEFVDAHVALVEPLNRECALAYWRASLTGSESDFKRYADLQMRLEQIYADPDDFARISDVCESKSAGDGNLGRIADLLYLRYLGNQVDPGLLGRIVDLAASVENRFSTFRPVAGGRELTTNEVYRILRTEADSEKRREVWEASKKVGRLVAEDLLELVSLRNESARQIGYGNFYTMSLELSEQSEDYLVNLFAELDELTREPFLEMKEEIDRSLAKCFHISRGGIQPWHYHDPYFQEVPQIDGVDLDRYFKDRDVVEIAGIFFKTIGMSVDDILERSDLYEKQGKNPHAYCTDIDRKGDIRILANVQHNSYWLETMLHELGHGVYDKYIDSGLPYILRSYPHLCTTEACAMFFGRMGQDPVWLKAALGLEDRVMEGIASYMSEFMRKKQLIFARWCQVMFNFERELYRNPQHDLNSLWWDIVERFQYVRRPDGRSEPDWATKIHIVSSPVYYHNYMLGELIASQFRHHIMNRILGAGGFNECAYGRPEVGEYFRNTVFRPGNTMPWPDHIEKTTGEVLSARHFAAQFVKEPR